MEDRLMGLGSNEEVMLSIVRAAFCLRGRIRHYSLLRIESWNPGRAFPPERTVVQLFKVPDFAERFQHRMRSPPTLGLGGWGTRIRT